jgi:phenylalanyl-tRNA synthetase beta chain
MRVPYEWLREFTDITASPEEVAERLTMIGLEVEEVEERKDDTVFEVNITPNRPDCLSIIGIAREISVAFKTPLIIPGYHIKEEYPSPDFAVEIANSDLCNRYAGRVIEGVRISDSPEWIQRRLEKCSIRSINNVVDITNYVLLEYGHPLHAFDASKIKGKKIRVASAGPQNKIVTLDGIERGLPEDALLIWDSERPIAIAGIMGGLKTEVSDRTKDIFLEGAYFNPFSIRRTSKRLNLTSESSYRFERGTDIEFLDKALNRAASMIREIAGGTIYKIIDAYPVKYMSEPVEVAYKRINKMLGLRLLKEEILEILNLLGIHTKDKGDVFLVYPPAYRNDIKRDSDIAEEIARIYGYDMILKRIPMTPLSSGHLNKNMMSINKIKEAMRKSGFTEVINYSFMNPSDLDIIAIPETDRRHNTIAIKNPLRKEDSLLRTTLIPALIENCKYNFDREIRDIRFFEISRVFEDVGRPLPLEELRLGGIFSRDKSPSLWREDVRGYFIAKGALESMFGEIKISEYSFKPSSEPFLHTGQASDIYISDLYTGYIGVLAPEIMERLDLKKKLQEIVVFEINMDLLLTRISELIEYSSIPKYPSIERDIAITVDDTIFSSAIKEIIRSFPSELIEDISVFDFYKGSNIPEGKKSLAFNIIYRSKEKTLTDKEVEEVHFSLVKYILDRTGGELRGNV